MSEEKWDLTITPKDRLLAVDWKEIWRYRDMFVLFVERNFRTAYKRLKKRHKSLEYDFEQLLLSLLQDPYQGVELEGGARKVRLAITSKGRGKSGGARVIIRVRIVADELQLLYIYDKVDFENVNDAYLRDVMKRMDI